MSGDTANKRRSRFQLSLEPPFSDHIHHLKRSKTTSSSARRPSKLMTNITIDDLSDFLLLEILCRLPCNKLVFQSKCVSRRWCTLISNPYFTGRFLRLQVNKQTPIKGNVINPKGEDISTRMSSPVFKTLMTVHGLKQEPVVVGTYNDLVLCCASQDDQCDYYICNPNTSQWVALPPTPTKWQRPVPVGFICDIPYYNYKQDDDALEGSDIVQLNPEYRCQVVRILPNDQYDEIYDCFKLKLELFSFETGEWRVSVVLSPLNALALDVNFSFAYNGMLYWWDVFDLPQIVGLDPFVINNINSSTSSSNGDDVIDYYKCRVLKFDDPSVGGDDTVISTVECLGLCRECVRMCNFNEDLRSICVYDLKEEQDYHDPIVANGVRKFFLERTRDYWLDENMFPEDYEAVVEVIADDPNNEDILYLNIQGDVVMCNIRTTEWSKLATFESNLNLNGWFFSVLLPWWPTPVPKLPQHVHYELAYGGGTTG